MKKIDKAFLDAAEAQDKDALQDAIINGANVKIKNEGGTNALSIAARLGNLGMANFLASSGVPVTGDALVIARMTEFDTSQRMIALLENWKIKQMEPDTKGLKKVDATLLRASSLGNQIDVIKAIKDGAQIDVLDKHDATPLRWAIRKGHEKIAMLLIKSKADVNHISKNEWTPLMEAGASGEYNLVRALLKAGANPAFQNTREQNAEIVTRHGGFNDLADEIRNAIS
jgi:uncharacterized protein